MAFLKLNLTSLNDLDDGRVAKAFEHELRRAVQDCVDRPKDKNKRTVTLELALEPILSDDGGIIECEGAHGEFKIKSHVPTRKSKTYDFRVNKAGHLSYSANSPDNADPTALDDINPETGRVER